MSENIENSVNASLENKPEKIALSVVLHSRRGSRPIGIEAPSTTTPQKLAESLVRTFGGSSTEGVSELADSRQRNLMEPQYRDQSLEELGIKNGETLQMFADIKQGAQRIQGRGYEGWLRGNLDDLMEFQKRYKGFIAVVPSKDLRAFEVTIKGKGSFTGAELRLLCEYPSPVQPPTFKILNCDEIASLNHPHITAIRVCLKAPWTPSTPITVPLEALKKAWWGHDEVS